ncbi:hypothetical protein NL676_010343 [Syzygium grande]|nr:hypothetical protein NL676_010343 [Syzygium grande]
MKASVPGHVNFSFAYAMEPTDVRITRFARDFLIMRRLGTGDRIARLTLSGPSRSKRLVTLSPGDGAHPKVTTSPHWPLDTWHSMCDAEGSAVISVPAHVPGSRDVHAAGMRPRWSALVPTMGTAGPMDDGSHRTVM